MKSEIMTMVAALVCAADMTAAAVTAPRWISGNSADLARPAPMLLKDFKEHLLSSCLSIPTVFLFSLLTH